jgi:hypothetical protein
MPYGYYQIVRVVAMVVFAIFAYQSFQNSRSGLAIIYVVLAILFQPFEKIALGREIWNLVDVIVGVALIGSILIEKPKE